MNLMAWLYPYPKQKINVAYQNVITDLISIHTLAVSHYITRSTICTSCRSVNLGDRDPDLDPIEHEGIEIIGKMRGNNYSIFQAFCPFHNFDYHIRHGCSDTANEYIDSLKAQGNLVVPEEAKILLLEGKFGSRQDLDEFMLKLQNILLENEVEPLFSKICVSVNHSRRKLQQGGFMFRQFMKAGRLYLCLVLKRGDRFYADFSFFGKSLKPIIEKSLEFFTPEDERLYELLFQPGSQHLQFQQLINMAHNKRAIHNFVGHLFKRPSIVLANKED